ncbi:MAG: DNA repair protein RecO C-terminal domain-containing protein [Bacteroidales bacterium]|nr:DNA repair protein RecO C-terminal domain-containing protein [Bacteroidales bacterium]
MVHATQLIVLSATKVGDKSLVLHTLSQQWGRRSFITSVSRKSPLSLFLPLTILEGEVVENPKSELWRLREIGAASPLNGIRNDVRKNTMTLFLSEVLLRTLKDGDMEEGLFEWCRGSIMTLDAMESDFSNFHLRFLLEFSGALGFSPSLDDLMPFAGEYLGLLRQLLQASMAESMLIPMNGAQRNAVASLLLDYISYHIGTQLQVRSLQVLRELYQ